MASSSSFLLGMAALAALLSIGLCGTTLTLTVSKGSSSTCLALVANVTISEVSVKQKNAMDWSDNLKESLAKTFTLGSKAPIKGPISVRFAVKGGGYRVIDDVIPVGFKRSLVYKIKEQI